MKQLGSNQIELIRKMLDMDMSKDNISGIIICLRNDKAAQIMLQRMKNRKMTSDKMVLLADKIAAEMKTKSKDLL